MASGRASDIHGHALVDVAVADPSGDVLRDVEPTLRGLDPILVDFAHARHAHSSGRWEECARRAAAVVDADPTAINTRRLWSDAVMRMGRYDEALRLAKEVVDESHEPEPDDLWRVVVAASGADDWDSVRDAATAIGWELPMAPGPIDEPMGTCILRFPDGVEELAERRSPATARVLSIAPPSVDQHVGDLVLLEPRLLVEPPEEPADDWLPTYPVLEVIEPGNWDVHLAFGADASSAADFDRIRDHIEPLGARLWVQRTGIPIVDEDDEEHTAFWGSIGLPPGSDAGEIGRTLAAVEWEGPLCSVTLAEATGDHQLLARHRELAEAWGF